jgi:tripartite-type tricarboxylate transporter receptor subunit TctC
MKRFCVWLLAYLLAASPVMAEDAISFHGKTVTMIVGSAPGGGTDSFGRMVAPFLTTYLPGSPNVLLRNIPGADGITSMNFMVQQVVPDGSTLVTVGNTMADPLIYRKAASRFDPTSFAVVGGGGRGGEVLLINKEAEKRLYDKKATPLIMGSIGGIPRSGMQMTAWGVEFLGWNVRWVLGYRGSSELMLALERGEIEMTATGNFFLIQRLIDTGKFKILTQSGALRDGAVVARPEFGDGPIFAKVMEGKISDTIASKAFEYWSAMAVMDKWMALPPKSPQAMLGVYREAYGKVARDPEFLDRGKKISDDFEPMLSKDVETLVHKLGSLPPEATEYMTVILRKQGLDVQ